MVLPYHVGELAVIERAGTFDEAVRNAAVFRPDVPAPLERLLGTLRWFLLAGRDRGGDVWASVLTGPAGFLTVEHPRRLTVRGRPVAGDPLTELGTILPDGDPAGGLAIDLSRRLRARLNGRAVATPDGLHLELEEIYSNCMKYIQRRPAPPPVPDDGPTGIGAAGVDRPTGIDRPTSDERLAEADIELLARADTFFLATAADGHGVDVSHRGVRPGGITVRDARTLWFPEYPGNGMFNSLGNLELDTRCGLLVADLPSLTADGVAVEVLQLSGRALAEDAPRDLSDGGVPVRFVVTFTVDRVVRSRRALPVGTPVEYSPFLPREP